MSKYIIRNCPCYEHYENSLHLCCDGQGNGECQDCTDCVMKQVVDYCLDNEKYGDGHYTRPILEKIDIQEIK